MQLAPVAPSLTVAPKPPIQVGFTDAISRIQTARANVDAQQWGRALFQLTKALSAVSYGAMLLTTPERTWENVNRYIHASQDIGFALAHLGHLDEAKGSTSDHLSGMHASLNAAEQALRELPNQ